MPSSKPEALSVDNPQWQIITNILQQHIPEFTVWAFGSRVKPRHAKTYSDLDLAVISQQPLTIQLQVQLEEAFEQSLLPWKVDIVDWASTSEHFRSIIKQHYCVIQQH